MVYTEGDDGPYIQVRRGCARAVRHYNPQHIETLGENASEYQVSAMETIITPEMISNESVRINIE